MNIILEHKKKQKKMWLQKELRKQEKELRKQEKINTLKKNRKKVLGEISSQIKEETHGTSLIKGGMVNKPKTFVTSIKKGCKGFLHPDFHP